MSQQRYVGHLKRLVIQSGGEWCGIQDAFMEHPPMLLFNSKTTKSTLAIPFDPDTVLDHSAEIVAAIKERIAKSDALFADRPVYVKTAVLRRIASTLLELYTEIDNLYLKRGQS